jgi:hypothetical protein
MTQEELDELMNGGIDDLDDLDVSDEEIGFDDSFEEDLTPTNVKSDKKVTASVPEGYNEETSHHWPLPATDENKMVHQLDDVTKESEEKASEIFDIIDGINSNLMDNEESLHKIVEVIESNITLFTTLTTKFPDVEVFHLQLEKNEEVLGNLNDSIEVLQTSVDSIMNIMDIMQYQDIHRQKIERVINVMRALSKYMNTLFEGKIEDSKRVSSAQHIAGDTHNDLASTDDIEALLAQFGK